jgi:hypothetical protein
MSPPGDDFLLLFSSLNITLKRFKAHFDATFAKPLRSECAGFDVLDIK